MLIRTTRTATARKTADATAKGPAPADTSQIFKSGGAARASVHIVPWSPGVTRPASSGLPHGLRANLEQKSGIDLSDVRVFPNSQEPERVDALAFARGRDIHLAAGEERHLGHEAWHVVQQRQGRVKPTSYVGGIPVNDDASLEREAETAAHHGTMQRFVKTRKNPKNLNETLYYSSWQPSRTFKTAKQAEAHDRKLEKSVGSKALAAKTRHPTMYTYMNTKPHVQLSLANQGPHNFAHVNTSENFEKARLKRTATEIFNEQVPPPEGIEEILNTEKPRPNPIERARLERYLFDYRSAHERTTQVRSSKNPTLKQNMVREMMELHPYGTYSWRSPGKASHRNLKGKGERKGNEEKSADTGGIWADEAAGEAFVNLRKRLGDAEKSVPAKKRKAAVESSPEPDEDVDPTEVGQNTEEAEYEDENGESGSRSRAGRGKRKRR